MIPTSRKLGDTTYKARPGTTHPFILNGEIDSINGEIIVVSIIDIIALCTRAINRRCFIARFRIADGR